MYNISPFSIFRCANNKILILFRYEKRTDITLTLFRCYFYLSLMPQMKRLIFPKAFGAMLRSPFELPVMRRVKILSFFCSVRLSRRFKTSPVNSDIIVPFSIVIRAVT